MVIIGFANILTNKKYIFEYENVKDDPQKILVKNINPYLIDGKNILVTKRTNPINKVPEMKWGSKPVDGGNFLFNDVEKNEFLELEPKAIKYIRPFISANEYLNGQLRWCLWLEGADPSSVKDLKLVVERIKNVQEFRRKSKKKPTREAAKFPALFAEIRQPKSNFIFFPLTTSENRHYIPLDFFTKQYIINNSSSYITDASLFDFGVLSSTMHIAWASYTCGRLEGRLRYSNTIVYNNFPWPDNPTKKQTKTVEVKAQKVLDAREKFPASSLADLYHPLTMPSALVSAHQELDKAVDLCYRPQPFPNETKRIEFLFELYEKYTQPLISKAKKSKKK